MRVQNGGSLLDLYVKLFACSCAILLGNRRLDHVITYNSGNLTPPVFGVGRLSGMPRSGVGIGSDTKLSIRRL